MHNREIRSTYDDSVVAVANGHPLMIRRARGYAPLPVRLPAGPPRPMPQESLLATGGELKNTFCLTRGSDAFVSQHIGNLENAETLLHFERTETLYEQLFGTRPTRIASDMHPAYLSTAYSLNRSEPVIKVQHHRAHVASCLAENSVTGPVIGVAFDGTGFGDDGAIWGGEFFCGSLQDGFVRTAHLEYFPLLGGEAAIHEPWRTALALTWHCAPHQIDFVTRLLKIPPGKKELLLRQLTSGLNCPATSSCGRLFDAVGALALGRLSASYEAQAAMELEAVASNAQQKQMPPQPSYNFLLDKSSKPWIISPAPAIREIINDIQQGEKPATLAYGFHLGLAKTIAEVCRGLAGQQGLDTVALSGGVFQNLLLLHLVRHDLTRVGLKVLTHGQLPPNDGGLSLGQAAMVMFSRKYE
jgi:hydrogenase maturation protein HypF